jgi:hypothetical protein
MNSKYVLFSSFGLVATLGWSMSANASTLAAWTFTSASDQEVTVTASTLAPDITGGVLQRGAGLSADNCGTCFNAAGWNNDLTDYLSFGLSINSGYQADLEFLNINTRSSSTGPGTLKLFYSGDGFTSSLWTFNQANTNNISAIINLSGLSNLTNSVEFRIYQDGNTAVNGSPIGSAGTFRINALELTGTVQPATVPVPGAVWLFGSALLGMIGFLRRTA